MLRGLDFDIAHTLGTSVLLLSFALLYQRRLAGVLEAFALQAFFVAAAAAWQAWSQDSPHLYITTTRFLEYFGLKDLKDMPDETELDALFRESTQPLMETAPAPSTDSSPALPVAPPGVSE